jgi:hypothetical protein
MAGADIHRFSADQRGAGINALLATAAGGLAALADTLLLPSLVLTLFAGQLTGSFVAVGLVAAAGAGFWALGRLPAAVLVPARRRKQPWAFAAALVRAAALALLALMTFRADAGQIAGDNLLRVLLLCFGVFSLANGFASVPIEALVAKAAPTGGRGAFYRQRALVAGACALIAALVVARVLQAGGPSAPRPFALLFLAAAVCHVAVAVLLASIREPLRVADPRGVSPATALRSLPRMLGDGDFVRFLLFRVTLAATALVDPFLVLFALSRLGIAPVTVGAYVVAYVLGLLMARPIWAALARRSGERAVLQGSALLRLAPPLLALVLPYLAETTIWRDRAADGRALEILFGAAFWCIGAAAAGQARGTFGYLAEFASARARAGYAAVLNVALTVAAFAPILGGLLVARAGYDGLFIVAAAIALLAVFLSGALTNAFVRGRPLSFRPGSPPIDGDDGLGRSALSRTA